MDSQNVDTEGRQSPGTRLRSYSKPFIPAGTSRNNYEQLFSRHAFAGHHDADHVPSLFREVGKGMSFSLPIARDGDIFLASSRNVPKKQFLSDKEKQRTVKKEYDHDDFARSSFKSNVINKRKSRPKRKKPPLDDEIEPPRQPKESPKVADYRLPKPKKSEKLPQLPVPKDTSFVPNSIRKRTFPPKPKPKPTVTYHQDVIGLGVDLPLEVEDSDGDLPEKRPVKTDKVVHKPLINKKSDNKPPPTPPAPVRKPSNVFAGFHRRKSSPKTLGVPDRLSPGLPEENPLPDPPYTDSGLDGSMDDDTQSEAMTKSDKAEEEEEEEENSDEEMEEHISPQPTHSYPTWDGPRPPTPKDGTPWSQAYVKAISKARRRNMPRTLEDFNDRFTRAFTYSYFRNDHQSTCKCNNCLQYIASTKNKKKKSKKSKARAEMKKILGNVKIYDYFKFSPHKRSKRLEED